MISSSEVGGCCRVQVAQLPSDRPLSPHRPQGHVTPLAAAGTLPLFRPSIPSALSDSANLQNFRPYHRRSYAYRGGGCESLQGCSPLHPIAATSRNVPSARGISRQKNVFSASHLPWKFYIEPSRRDPRARAFALAKNFVGGCEGGTRYARHYLNYQAIRVMRYRVKGLAVGLAVAPVEIPLNRSPKF